MIATDISPDMCNYMREELPYAVVEQLDLCSEEFFNTRETYDVVCIHYVLQFIHPEHQWRVLGKVMDLVRPGGVLILGHKHRHNGELGGLMHDEYMKFRVANGYTMAEIAAKTAALKGSMFPMDNQLVIEELNGEFTQVEETFRFMMFNTIFAVK